LIESSVAVNVSLPDGFKKMLNEMEEAQSSDNIVTKKNGPMRFFCGPSVTAQCGRIEVGSFADLCCCM